MEKKTVRQFSLLGLVLMGASALTAAVVPSKAAPVQGNSADNGKAVQFSNDNAAQAVLSCVAVDDVFDCHITALSGTTGVGVLGTKVQSVGGRLYDTVGNTSASNPLNANDTTSQLVRIS